MNKKRVPSHVLEKVMVGLMVVFFVSALLVFYSAWTNGTTGPEVAMIEILIIIILALLSQTIILIRIYDQH